jgi:D-alanyl-D-alanine carboxypeptidase/D-alanyl-D-alanine-endopeptidase (penicillin-binding protein 4)
MQKALRKVVAQRDAKDGVFAIVVKRLDGPVIFARRSRRRLHPASCVKLLTAAAALRKLGKDFRFDTVLEGKKQNAKLVTPLYFWGQGDPSLTHDDLYRFADKIKAKGIREIPKGILIDDSYFDHRRFPPGFGRPSAKSYIAPTGAVSIDGNSVAVTVEPQKKNGRCSAKVVVNPPSDHFTVLNRVRCSTQRSWLRVGARKRKDKVLIVASGRIGPADGPRTVQRRIFQPARFAGETLKHALQARGITVGKVQLGKKPQSIELIRHRSKPLIELVTHMNRFSDNHYAEQLLKLVGAKVFKRPGTTKKGLTVIQRFLTRAGVRKNRYVLTNGSGLFGRTRMSASQIVGFLQRVSTLDWLQKALVASLPAAGRNGTLGNRLDGSVAEGRVRAKTGTLRAVSCLSGYVLDRHKKPRLVFSILHNRYKGSARKSRKLQDQAARAMVRYLNDVD